eukprot:jgi/Mesen1/6824/ME000035S06208
MEEKEPLNEGPKSDKTKKREVAAEGLMKAIIKDGEGEMPDEGDMVTFHCTVRTQQGAVCESTRSEHGGAKCRVPSVKRQVLVFRPFSGNTWQAPYLNSSLLKVKPEQHYGAPGCPLAASEGFPASEELLFELELAAVHRAVKPLTDDCGVCKQVLRAGEGWEQPRPPYEVKCSVEARVVGGGETPVFSATRNAPLYFALGNSQVPAGLEAGIESMLRNESAIIHVSSARSSPAGLITGLPAGPPRDVEFHVELLQIIQVRDMLGDGGVIKRRLEDGRGDFPVDCPMEDTRVRLHYAARLLLPGGQPGALVYDSRSQSKSQRQSQSGGSEEDGASGGGSGGEQPLEVGTGEGLLPEAVDMSVRLMLPAEKARVTSTSKYAYDTFPWRPEGVPEGAAVQFELELDWATLSFDEIMEEADRLKELGNGCFKRARPDLAKKKYERLLRELQNVHPHSDAESATLHKAKAALQLNVAACCQKLNEFAAAIEWANKVLEGEPLHAKALFRRGTAHTSNGDFDEARRDFLNEAMAKAKKQFKGLFDKKPGELSEEKSAVEPSHEEKEVKEEEEQEERRDDKDRARVLAAKTPASYWSVGKQYLNAMGLSRCNIL